MNRAFEGPHLHRRPWWYQAILFLGCAFAFAVLFFAFAASAMS